MSEKRKGAEEEDSKAKNIKLDKKQEEFEKFLREYEEAGKLKYDKENGNFIDCEICERHGAMVGLLKRFQTNLNSIFFK